MGLRKLKLSVYLHYFFDDFIFIYPFYALYFEENGLTGTSFSFLMMIWTSSVLLFEIPSGLIADKASRKYIIIFGELIRALGYLVWLVYPTFIGFAIGFVAWGFKSALRSGAMEALLYDNLTIIDRIDQFKHIMSRARFLQVMSVILVTFLAGQLVHGGYEILFYLSIVSLLISMIALLGLKDLRLEEVNENLLGIFKKGMSHLKSKKVIYLVMLGQSLYIMGMLDEYWGLFSSEIGFTLKEISYIFVGLMLIEALALLIAPKLNKVSIVSMIILGGIIVAATIRLNPVLAIMGVGIANASFKALGLLVDVRFQHAFQSGVRATVTSVKGFLDEVFCISFYGILALLATVFDYTEMFYYASLLTVIIGVGIWILGKTVLRTTNS